MEKSQSDIASKKMLLEIAALVSDLPQNLQGPAFSTLLEHRIISMKGTTIQIQKKEIGSPTQKPLEIKSSSSFGEYFGSFPSGTKSDEKLLVAASFAEITSGDRSFTVNSAHELLKDIGVKLSNAAVFMKSLVDKKLVFTLGKFGKNTYKYRVSAKGNSYLKELKAKI